MPEHFVGKVSILAQMLPDFSFPSFIVGSSTLAIMLIWPKFKTVIPPHLIAIVAASLLAYILNSQGANISTIGSTFSFTLPDGSLGNGIPSILPNFEWPWLRAQPNEDVLVFSWQLAVGDRFIISSLRNCHVRRD